MNLAGFELQYAVPLDERQVLHRGCDEKGQVVLVRTPASAFPDPRIVGTIRQDYEVAKSLSDLVAAVPREYHTVGRSCALVYSAEVGMPLKLRLAEGALSFPEFLQLATAAAESLRALHAYGIVHRDVRPANLFVHEDGERVRIAGLGSSARSGGSETGLPKEPVGTLTYMSPEATTRVQRAIDERSDIYSFGITLYEMLVGEPPFPDDSAVALVHAHLALAVPATGDRREDVPAVLDAIIRKCTEKTPENRYQSVSAICDDLKRCLTESAAGTVQEFEIGRTDLATKLDLGETLYGRDEDWAAVSAAHQRTAGNKSELVLIAGAPGIGKTALADRLRRDVLRNKGLVLFGKFDPAKASAGIPFSAFSSAFNGLTTQILSLREEEVELWKSRVLETLGANARIVVDVAPHMELLLGRQDSVEEVGPEEALNRLHYAFRQLVAVLAQHASCLVIIIDDLQWADLPSLRLLESLLVHRGSRNMLAVGTYRDEETPHEHPLHAATARIEEAGVAVTLRMLEALTSESITPLIMDTLRWEPEQARELADLVHNKTAGSPFFIKQLIQSFARQGTLAYSPDHGAWFCDMERLRAVPGSDSVADLLLGSLKDLPSETQQLLTYGAFAGNKFDAGLVASLSELSLDAVVSCLAKPVSQGLMTRSEGKYAFAHDRIQQAALELAPEAVRDELSLQIGRMLRAKLSETEEEGLFDVVGHLNRAGDRIDDSHELLDLARLNYRAARAARKSAAFEPCAAYLRKALSLYDGMSNGAVLHPEIHGVLVILAECEYALHDSDAGDAAVARGLKQAQSPRERAEILYAQGVGYHQLARHADSINSAISALRHLGLRVRREATGLEVLYSLVRLKLAIAGREIEELYDVGDSCEEDGQLMQKILTEMGPSAHQSGRQNLLAIAYCEGARVAIKTGYVAKTISVFAGLGLGLGGALNHRTGYRINELALRLGERFDSPFNLSIANFISGCFLSHWFDDVDTSIARLYEAYEVGKKAGNVPYAAYAISLVGAVQFFRGRNIDEVLSSTEEAAAFTSGRSDTDRFQHAMILKVLCQALKDPELKEEFDPDWYNDTFHETGMSPHLSRTHTYLMILRFLRGEYEEAYANGKKALPHAPSVALMCDEDALHFYLVLCCCELARRAKGGRQRRYLSEARRHLKPLAKGATERPENREHRRVIATAMLQTTKTGLTPRAAEMIEKAITGALEGGFLFDAGLANLCAARLAVFSGLTRQAGVYFRDAAYYYGRVNAPGVKEFVEREQQAAGADSDTRTEIAGDASARAAGSLERVDVDTLVGALRDIASTVRLGDVIKHVMTAIIQNAGAERGLFAMTHGGGIAVEALASDGRVEVLSDHPRLNTIEDAPHAVAYYAWRVRETVVTKNAAESIEFGNDPYVQRTKLKSVLCVPVLLRGTFQGLVCLENNLLPNAFSADRVQIVETLAAQAAGAIENARLYQTLEDKVEERTRELRNAQDRVVRLEREATEAQMASGFAHEMRNALAAARNNLGQVLEPLYDDEAASHFDKVREAVGSILDLVEPVTDSHVLGDVAAHLESIVETQEHLERTLGAVDQSTSRALDVTTQILRYSRLVHEKSDTETVELGDLIRGLFEELGQELLNAGIDFRAEIKSDCMVKGLRTHYYSVLSNIVLNARDALSENESGTKTIEVNVETDGSNAIVRVIDNGPGMSPEVQDKVFVPFFSTKGAKGTGLGMSVVRRLVGLYDGTIALESEQGEGTAFTLRFPAHLHDGVQAHE